MPALYLCFAIAALLPIIVWLRDRYREPSIAELAAIAAEEDLEGK